MVGDAVIEDITAILAPNPYSESLINSNANTSLHNNIAAACKTYDVLEPQGKARYYKFGYSSLFVYVHQPQNKYCCQTSGGKSILTLLLVF